uniref:basic salivary proline-rich protein 1-like n=1 Tax=Podarcis muralis TaxID=64176 RepID=UPI0010A018A8|nr:basic salivary proline-rich protein 1-like [Podarcis muralis]
MKPSWGGRAAGPPPGPPQALGEQGVAAHLEAKAAGGAGVSVLLLLRWPLGLRRLLLLLLLQPPPPGSPWPASPSAPPARREGSAAPAARAREPERRAPRRAPFPEAPLGDGAEKSQTRPEIWGGRSATATKEFRGTEPQGWKRGRRFPGCPQHPPNSPPRGRAPTRIQCRGQAGAPDGKEGPRGSRCVCSPSVTYLPFLPKISHSLVTPGK